MNPPPSRAEQRQREQQRIAEAEATLRAISLGEVDAVVVQQGNEHHVHPLDAAHRPYRFLIERMRQAAMTVAHDGRIEYANPWLGELLGRSSLELVGTTIATHVDTGDRAALLALLAAAGEQDVAGEIRLRAAGGRALRAHVAVSAVAGLSSLRCVILTDLTDRDRLEEEQAARTAAEQEGALLRDADRRKDEFLAMLAHELRSPLAPLRNAIEVLRLTQAGDDATRSLYGMMNRQIENLVRLVDDLLDVGRVTQGKIRLQRLPVDLGTVLARAVESAQPVLDARRHRLIVTVCEEGLMVDADLIRLAQVIINLLHNAAKFTPPGGTVTLELARDGEEAVVRVRDTGIGISPQQLPQIFGLFVQVDPSTSRTEGGLGIGLTLARRLMELHGGTLAAQSDGADRGSTFTLRLPAHPAGRRSAEHPVSRAVDARPARRVMVVDDNRDAAQTLVSLLCLDGHHARAEFSGEAALAALGEFTPDVLILDIGLPGLSGYDVARTLVARGDAPCLVALSGYGGAEDRERSRDAGFALHLVKPVDLGLLRQALATA